MTSQKKSTILQNIADKYKRQSDVLGVLVFGSFVRGNFDKYSDIDVYILQNKKPTYSRESYMLNAIRVDVTIDGKIFAEQSLKAENHSVRRVFSHMLAYGEILFEKKRTITSLQKIAINNLKSKTKYTKDELLMHLYSIEDFYGEVLRFQKVDDVFSFEQNMNLLINNSIECFLKIKGEYLQRPNELRDIIRKADPIFGKTLESIYRSRNNSEKVQGLERLVKRIEILASGPLPKKWKVR